MANLIQIPSKSKLHMTYYFQKVVTFNAITFNASSSVEGIVKAFEMMHG